MINRRLVIQYQPGWEAEARALLVSLWLDDRRLRLVVPVALAAQEQLVFLLSSQRHWLGCHSQRTLGELLPCRHGLLHRSRTVGTSGDKQNNVKGEMRTSCIAVQDHAKVSIAG